VIYANPTPPIAEEEVFKLRDLSGGQRTAISSTLLKDEPLEYQKAENVSFSFRGALKLRETLKDRYSSDISTEGILGFGSLYKTDGTSRLVIAVEDKLYYDSPHYEVGYYTQAQWETGTLLYLSASDTPGWLVIDTTGAPASLLEEYNDATSFDTGTHYYTQVNASGYLEAAIPNQINETKTNTIDFVGTYNDDIAVEDGSIKLLGDVTFDAFSSMTFDELIAL